MIMKKHVLFLDASQEIHTTIYNDRSMKHELILLLRNGDRVSMRLIGVLGPNMLRQWANELDEILAKI